MLVSKPSNICRSLNSDSVSYLFPVVFVELPEDILTFNKPAQLRGLIKAPTNSTVIVRHDKIRITDRNEEESLSFCDHAPHVSISKEEIDDGNFSMFTILINVAKSCL